MRPVCWQIHVFVWILHTCSYHTIVVNYSLEPLIFGITVVSNQRFSLIKNGVAIVHGIRNICYWLSHTVTVVLSRNHMI